MPRQPLRLANWRFEASQPQRITSGLKTNVSPSSAFSAIFRFETAKFFKIHKIGFDIKEETKHTITKHKFSKK